MLAPQNRVRKSQNRKLDIIVGLFCCPHHARALTGLLVYSPEEFSQPKRLDDDAAYSAFLSEIATWSDA